MTVFTSPVPVNSNESAVALSPLGLEVEVLPSLSPDIATYVVPAGAGFNATSLPLTVSGGGRLFFVKNNQATAIRVVGPDPSDTGVVMAAGASALFGVAAANGLIFPIDGAATKRYCQVQKANAAQVGINTGTDLLWDEIVAQGPGTGAGAIVYDSVAGTWALSAGVTYRLRAQPSFLNWTTPAAAFAAYQWVDSANNELFPGAGVGYLIGQDAAVFDSAGAPEAFLIFKPTVATLVKVRVVDAGGGPFDMPTAATGLMGGWACVEEL